MGVRSDEPGSSGRGWDTQELVRGEWGNTGVAPRTAQHPVQTQASMDASHMLGPAGPPCSSPPA